MIAEERGDYDKAQQFFIEGLDYRRTRMQYNDLAHSYLHLANLGLAKNDFSMVTTYCDSAEMMVSELFNTEIEQFGASEENKNRYLGMSKQFRAELYFKEGNTSQMYDLFKQAQA